MQVTLENTIGAGFLGSVVSFILFGITIVQGYLYYVHYPNDWAFQKAIVALLLALDTIHTGLTTYSVYHYVIQEFGNLFALELVVWSLKLQVLFDVIILLMVQSLYVMRIWKLGRHFSPIWPMVTIVIQAGAYVVGILLVHHTYTIHSWADLPRIQSVIKATFSYATAIDIVLAASMCYYLNKSKSKISFSITNNRIVAIIHYILISGTLTSATSLTILICYVAMPENLVFIAITFIVTKVYINSYLAMLNARSLDRDGSVSYNSSGQKPSPRWWRSTHIVEPSLDDIHNNKDFLQLSALKFRTRTEGDISAAHGRSVTAQPPTIGIQVHRLQEKITDNENGYWSPA